MNTYKTLTQYKEHNRTVFLLQIRSDNEYNVGDVQYSLHGVGADVYPYNVFYVDANTGFVKATRALDREIIHQYNVRVTASPQPPNDPIGTSYTHAYSANVH